MTASEALEYAELEVAAEVAAAGHCVPGPPRSPPPAWLTARPAIQYTRAAQPGEQSGYIAVH